MKSKGIILAICLFIIFIMLTFATPFIEGRHSSLIWMLFLTGIMVLGIVWAIIKLKNTPKEELIERCKKQPITIQLVEISAIVSVIYESVFCGFNYRMSIVLIGILILYDLFLKKEED